MSRPRNSQRRPAIYPDRRKVCPGCGVEKPWSAFYVLRRHPDDRVAAVRSKCKLCESRRAQDVWQQNVSRPPEEREAFLEARRRYHADRMANDPEYAEMVRKQAREDHRYRYANDPAYREDVKERSRRFARSPRGRMLERNRRRRARREMSGRGSRQHRMDPTPWWEFIAELLTEMTGRELERRMGIDEATIRRWALRIEGISLERADECLHRWGDPFLLHVLWPGEEESSSTPSGPPVILSA
jgi:hypothetical protein